MSNAKERERSRDVVDKRMERNRRNIYGIEHGSSSVVRITAPQQGARRPAELWQEELRETELQAAVEKQELAELQQKELQETELQAAAERQQEVADLLRKRLRETKQLAAAHQQALRGQLEKTKNKLVIALTRLAELLRKEVCPGLNANDDRSGSAKMSASMDSPNVIRAG